jgi:Mg-chelatase subunit ChlD
VVLKTSIDALVSTGFTNLSEGINLATTEFANPGDGHDRSDGTSPDKMIVVTDGHPNRPLPETTADDLAVTAADNARLAGIEVFVVGVGADVNTTFLQNQIANTGSGHYFSVSDYSGLQTTLKNLDLCQ